MKYIVTFFISIVFLSYSHAQNVSSKPKGDSVRLPHAHIIAYQFNRDFTSLDSIPIDTMLPRFQIYYKPFSERALNVFLGNVNQPYTSVIFPNRPPMNEFLFSQHIEYNFHQPEDMIYYKTWTPFTQLTYFTGGPKTRQEQKLNILHTQNVNKNLNVGFLGDLNYADGQYVNQRTRSNAFSLWAGYKGARYSAYGNITLNSYKGQENGGITSDTTYLYHSDVSANNLPVNLQAANVAIKRQSVFLNHRFYLTGSFKSDSLGRHSKWNEALSIIHQFRYDRYSRGFTDVLTTDSAFYQDPSIFMIKKNSTRDSVNFNQAATGDSSYFRRIENTFMLAFNANDLLKVPAELRVGIKSQVDKYKYGSKLDSIGYMPALKKFSGVNP
ncbi:MAG TPA: putative porin, partial [Bacteroidales bacterium]|nr:putative porin [Bacteroidales bacterium]